MMRGKQQGFALIELMMVIVGVLAAIHFTVIPRNGVTKALCPAYSIKELTTIPASIA